MKIYRIAFLMILLLCGTVAFSQTGPAWSKRNSFSDGKMIKITKNELRDKIKGGWAGQVIGCTYGGITEFLWNGTMVNDYVPIPWNENRLIDTYHHNPGLYDDVYMDLTFVDVFEKHGFEASDSVHAMAFAKAPYPLWHANQAARYNILNGIMPPQSGHWKNNSHADDIDFQIEADFAGLMAPGMTASAADIANRIGHIMNYGDGVYGGIFVASMYALAFVSNDVNFIVQESLKTIPRQSEFYQCISDIIKWHKKYPTDWKSTWFEAQKKWTSDIGCPEGVFAAFNIDAKINAAYIVIGLLYGNGDYGKTVDIATRCGYDTDCNAANAAGILGTVLGYEKIPAYWKQGLSKVENMNFVYTDMSLNKVYDIGYKHALQMVKKNGGKENVNDVMIKYQSPKRFPFEKSFEGIYPIKKERIGRHLTAENSTITHDFSGSGFVLSGAAGKYTQSEDKILEADVFIDEKFVETIKMPTNAIIRRYDVYWNYNLGEGPHKFTIKAKNIPNGYFIDCADFLTYSVNKPVVNKEVK